MELFFWMVSIVLIVAGIYFLLQRQWIYAAVAILVGALIGPIGVSRWWWGAGDQPSSAPPPADAAWLHVSAGLGTSPFAPVRFACRPEATLLTLTPKPAPGPA